MQTVKISTHPSLALIKYWGKANDLLNTAATPSLAVNLNALTTHTTMTFAPQDRVILQGKLQDPSKYARFFDEIRRHFKTDAHFFAESTNDFPTAAGLASSSSGFAALAFGAATLLDKNVPLSQVSSFARLGSASSARAVFPGFVALKEDALSAEMLLPASHWPSLKILIAIISEEAKPLSSREAMKRTKATSPCYPAWIHTSKSLFENACIALHNKDLHALGSLMRESTYLMFATMLSSRPPILYWMPATLSLLHTLESLRQEGLAVYETCDAGPQVKILVDERDLTVLQNVLKALYPTMTFLSSAIGEGAICKAN